MTPKRQPITELIEQLQIIQEMQKQLNEQIRSSIPILNDREIEELIDAVDGTAVESTFGELLRIQQTREKTPSAV